ncbi:hypothetical protein M8C21_024435 [Ambrosia artemisiifolia]|uniref:Uncharacterized protein n=1 Tax=Ambrosia artemisiifolia TaxID=4212 RepID=A0AAD5CED7_AMBAR|nr:hypothetical protein M8C21_024435 [Ambrosia artemisiifolia]
MARVASNPKNLIVESGSDKDNKKGEDTSSPSGGGFPELPNKSLNRRIAVVSVLGAIGLFSSGRLDFGVSLKDLSAAALPYEENLFFFDHPSTSVNNVAFSSFFFGHRKPASTTLPEKEVTGEKCEEGNIVNAGFRWLVTRICFSFPVVVDNGVLVWRMWWWLTGFSDGKYFSGGGGG